MGLTTAQGQNWGGGIQAVAMGIQTGFAIGNMVQQFNYAKANIQHQIDMSEMAFDHTMRKFNFEGETMGMMKALAKRHNKGAVDLVKSQSNLQVDKAELAEVRKTNESAKLNKAKAFKSVLNKRGSYPYGHPRG